ncbi:MAG: hypothetical protein IKO88_06935 [Bacteroidales bacterium]|nr:hypothetical protein [Bacteroidales bacterium]
MRIPPSKRKILIGATAAVLVVLIASLFHLDKFWNFVGAVAVMYVIVSLGSLIPSRRERRKKGLWEEDDFDLCERLYKALSAKTDGGTDLTALNEHEKIFLTMAQLDENCGFSEYFTKFRGVYNDLLVPSAEAVGSPEIAGICRRVLELHAGYSGPDEGLDDLFEQCLDDFIDSDDDLVELCAQYARDHKESFRE